MSSEVETMAYTGKVPWHGLGYNVANNLSPQQMLKAAKIDWTVEKRKLLVPGSNGKNIELKDRFGLIRTSDDAVLSVVGPNYKPVQNDISMSFFKKFVTAGKMKMETAGSLWNGRYIWCLARVDADFILGKEDAVQSYLLLSQPHVFGKAMTIQLTPIRVVCWNTLTYALGANLKGNGTGFRMPHSMEFNESVQERAAIAMKLATNQMSEFKEAATLLTKRKASAEKADEMFKEILKFDPKKQEEKMKMRKRKKEDDVPSEPRLLQKFRQALTFAPGATLPTAAGTAWGAVNAVTYVIDHEIGRDRGTAMKTAWMGFKAQLKRDAMKIALEKFK